jgi:hypothetical protein
MIQIEKGKLAGHSLKELTERELREFAHSALATEMKGCSFYKGQLEKVSFDGVSFIECNFARVSFTRVRFRNCTFERVDLTRAHFRDCVLVDCVFSDSDPYYAIFESTEVEASAFRRCYVSLSEWNKAVVLFAHLRKALEEYGETRASRAAEYYFRVWQRRRLYHRWRFKRFTGFGPWLWSLCIGALTGYGERPIYLGGWALGIVTSWAQIYRAFFSFALPSPGRGFMEFWYYSFKVFFARGPAADFQTSGLAIVQASEFLFGIIWVALLIGSVARKLSP